MIWPFRKKHTCLHNHYKEAGKVLPANMLEVIRFSDRKDDIYPFSVHQCVDCGKRAFCCMYYHCLPYRVSIAVDDFITYGISLKELCALFDKFDISYEV